MANGSNARISAISPQPLTIRLSFCHQPVRPAWMTLGSETETEREAHLPLRVVRVRQRRAAGDARDLTKRCGREAARRIRRHERVEDIPRFDARLEPLLTADRENPEHREIEVVAARSVE